VRQLFEAALLGPERAPWLAGPAAPASSVFTPEVTAEAAPFATLGGLRWLTANAAAQAPLALVVDDLHWCDPPSLHYLHYLVRRMADLPVLLVLGGRPGEIDELADAATAVLRPAPLGLRAIAQLIEQRLGARPDEAFTAACLRVTAGNPLLLVELLRALRAEGVVPDADRVEMIDHVGPSTLARIVLVRLRRLPSDALAVAQAIAVLGAGAATSLVAELAEVEERAVVAAVASLVDAEVIDARPPLGFVHPVVRDAILAEVTPDERDRRHARAAELLHAAAAAPDQVGAHLLLAAPRGLRWASDALRAAAADAAQRGAVETAVTFLRRALAERPGDADVELLLRLGLTEAAIAPAAAVGHLEAARRAARDPATRARAGELIARLLVFTDPPGAIAAARGARAELPPGAAPASLLALERYAGRFGGATAPTDAAPDRASAGGRTLMAVQAWDRALGGGTAQECAARAAEALVLAGPAGTSRPPARDPLLTTLVATTVLLFADDPRAQDAWAAWHAEAVRAGRAHALIADHVWQGWTQVRLGRLEAAEASLRAALEGPRAWGPGTETPPAHALSLLAGVLVERGDLAGAQAALDRTPPELSADSEGVLLCRCAELRLRTAQGRHAEALAIVDAEGARLRTVRNPAWAPWRSLQAEALAQSGRLEEARGAVSEELELARTWGTPGPIGRALSLLGALQGDVGLLTEAVETTRDHSYARLEHAGALLALGAAIRRGGRPREARATLRDAHDLAMDCGALVVAGKAHEELGAAGARPRPVADRGAASLTPSERRVAELAATGRRNQEIARQLHLSQKTIEVHLTSSYRKLGIRTRQELPEALEERVAVDG
jgi:DNA-binding CsgD family transcriptional regulator